MGGRDGDVADVCTLSREGRDREAVHDDLSPLANPLLLAVCKLTAGIWFSRGRKQRSSTSSDAAREQLTQQKVVLSL